MERLKGAGRINRVTSNKVLFSAWIICGVFSVVSAQYNSIINLGEVSVSPDTVTKHQSHDTYEPYTGELVRLRGGDFYNAGRVEVYRNGSWGIVCDDEWDVVDASVVCRQLRFMQGASSALSNSKYGSGGWHIADFKMDNVMCRNSDQYIQQCYYVEKSDCDVSEIASTACIPNTGCEDGWTPGRDTCYKIFNARLSRRLARRACLKIGAKLVKIDSEEESHFLSSLIINVQPKEILWHTAGVRIKGVWRWKDHDKTGFTDSTFTKWFPGWHPDHHAKQPSGNRGENCAVLQKSFPLNGTFRATDYTWWNDVNCGLQTNFICEKEKLIPIAVRDCYTGKGVDYRGYGMKTVKGTFCIKWTLIAQHQAGDDQLGIGDHNYCRNPDNDTKPWCYVDAVSKYYGYCDIPQCVNTLVTPQPLLSTTVSIICPREKFYCSLEDRCVPDKLRCNGIIDCTVGEEDEFGCDYALPLFDSYPNHVYVDPRGHHEQYTSITVEGCARMCVDAKHFVCRSFTYMDGSANCYLTSGNNLTGTLLPSGEHDYYELTSQTLNCSDMFNCTNGKCITLSAVCDGDDDCNDFSDEDDCGNEDVTVVRIVDGEEHSGRVEIRYRNEWGIICDDKWDKADADVICRMKGYSEAVRASSKAEFGSGNGNILLDDVDCVGDEPSIDNCSHSEWRQHDCYSYEAAGVVCLATKTCSFDHYTCPSHRCIPASLMCDGVNHCGDNDDERDCAVTVELVDGSHREGRVELIRNGVRGTICDDEWDDREATVICRMLGFSHGKAHNGDYFPPGYGTIWLDDVHCRGNETSIVDCVTQWNVHNCDHLEDAGVTCYTNLTSVTHAPPVAPPPTQLPIHSQCGKRPWLAHSSQGRIPRTKRNWDLPTRYEIGPRTVELMGGDSSALGQSPWQVGVRKRVLSQSIAHCGGTILNDVWILSTAHCFLCYNITATALRAHVPLPECGTWRLFNTTTDTQLADDLPDDLQLSEEVTDDVSWQYRPGAVPWQALIKPQWGWGGGTVKHWCGATVIADYWLISAAHCFLDLQKSSFTVRVGDLDNKIREDSEQEFEIDLLFAHDGYDRTSNDNDIALIKIRKNNGKAIVFSDTVQPACLPAHDLQYETGLTCHVSGWGKSEKGYRSLLRVADIPIIAPETCQRLYKGELTSRMFCAGFLEGGVDTCQGDSGGPFVCSVNGSYTVLGATSWGFGCARPNSPGVYAKVQAYLPWIYDKISSNP